MAEGEEDGEDGPTAVNIKGLFQQTTKSLISSLIQDGEDGTSVMDLAGKLMSALKELADNAKTVVGDITKIQGVHGLIEQYATLVRIAQEKPDVECVRRLLKVARKPYRMAIISASIGGTTALHHCLQEKNVEVLMVLLSSISDSTQLELVNIPDDKNGTVIIDAALKQGRDGVLKELFSALRPHVISSWLMSEDPTTRSPVLHSIFSDENRSDQVLFLLQTMQELLLNISEVLLCEDSEGKTIFHLAIIGNNFMVICRILQELLPPAERFSVLIKADKSNRTMLHYAAHLNQFDAIDLVLEQLEEKERRDLLLTCDKVGKTAVHDAVVMNNVAAIKCLLKYLSMEEQFELFQSKTHNEATILHIAAEKGNDEAIVALLAILSSHPASILSELLFIDDENHQTFLHHAHNLEKDTVQKVLRAIQTVNLPIVLSLRDHEQKTAVSKAIAHGKPDIVLAFLENLCDDAKVSILIPDNNVNNLPPPPLHLLATRDNFQFFRKVLELFTPDSRFHLIFSSHRSGSSVLHKAASEEFRLLLEFILDGYEKDLQNMLLQQEDNKGRNVLELAVAKPSLNDWVIDKVTMLGWEAMKAEFFIIAAHLNEDSFVQALLEMVPSENHISLLIAKDRNGNMLLQQIAYNLQRTTLKYLCRTHPPSLSWMLLTEQNHDRKTGLHLMASNPFTKVKDVAYILNHAGNTNDKTTSLLNTGDFEDRTPVAVAEECNKRLHGYLSSLYEVYHLFKPPTAIIIYYSHGREGAELEKQRLHRVLLNLGLVPVIKKNLKAIDICSCIRTIVEGLGKRKNCGWSESHYPDVSALMVFIMCHGEYGIICDHEDNTIPVQTVVNTMAELVPKGLTVPKVLVLQSCQGDGDPTRPVSLGFDAKPKENVTNVIKVQNLEVGVAESIFSGPSNSSASSESSESDDGTLAVVSQAVEEVAENNTICSSQQQRVPNPMSSIAPSSSQCVLTMPSVPPSPHTSRSSGSEISHTNQPISPEPGTPRSLERISLLEDFLVMLPSRDGLMAKRNYFIPILTDQLEKMEKNDDIYEIFLKTSREMDSGDLVQLPHYETSMKKKLLLKMKYYWLDN